jgi:hypothetical protein
MRLRYYPAIAVSVQPVATETAINTLSELNLQAIGLRRLAVYFAVLIQVRC